MEDNWQGAVDSSLQFRVGDVVTKTHSPAKVIEGYFFLLGVVPIYEIGPEAPAILMQCAIFGRRRASSSLKGGARPRRAAPQIRVQAAASP